MCICEDRHILLVGATRSGKSRRIILESIWLTLKAGENMLINDPKGELYAYTSPFAKDNGYQVVVIDFRNPNKGTHYNYMEEIITETLGSATSPNGQVIESTSVYSRISYQVDGYFGVTVPAEKDKLVDIVKNN